MPQKIHPQTQTQSQLSEIILLTAKIEMPQKIQSKCLKKYTKIKRPLINNGLFKFGNGGIRTHDTGYPI